MSNILLSKAETVTQDACNANSYDLEGGNTKMINSVAISNRIVDSGIDLLNSKDLSKSIYRISESI